MKLTKSINSLLEMAKKIDHKTYREGEWVIEYQPDQKMWYVFKLADKEATDTVEFEGKPYNWSNDFFSKRDALSWIKEQ